MADPKLTKQQKDDLKEFNELLKQQPKLFRSILGISETIKKSVTDTSDASEKIVKSNKAYLDIAKQVLINTKNIHKETYDVVDLNDQILEPQKSGDKVLGDQLKQLNRSKLQLEPSLFFLKNLTKIIDLISKTTHGILPKK